MPERFRGLPVVDFARCRDGCERCAAACPTSLIERTPRGVQLDLARCLFCTECIEACPDQAIRFTREFATATRLQQDLLLSGRAVTLAASLDAASLKLFGRSLKLRQVSAGGCNGCEADVNVLSTVVFDLGHFGIQFVPSPRHADGLLITGPVTRNMRLALEKTYAAVPAPKLVIAVGAGAVSGGPFAGFPDVHHGASSIAPVDLFVPGCPPHPLTILVGLRRLLGRIETRTEAE